MNSANVFLSVMSGYATFIAPITGLMVFDYFFVHKRKIKLTALVSYTHDNSMAIPAEVSP
jgi:NCS1 family nucleobase:cation symporter-1